MAFFILSTSKIILMRFCTGLGSLDLVPGFTVNFFTASSSCRENQEETQLNNPSKAVVVSSGRERIECHQKVKKKKRLRVKGLALVARRKMLSMDRMRLPVRPRSSRLLPILIPDTAEASSSAQADLQAPALPPTLGLLVPCAWEPAQCPFMPNVKVLAPTRANLGAKAHWTDGQILPPSFSYTASPKAEFTQPSL